MTDERNAGSFLLCVSFFLLIAGLYWFRSGDLTEMEVDAQDIYDSRCEIQGKVRIHGQLHIDRAVEFKPRGMFQGHLVPVTPNGWPAPSQPKVFALVTPEKLDIFTPRSSKETLKNAASRGYVDGVVVTGQGSSALARNTIWVDPRPHVSKRRSHVRSMLLFSAVTATIGAVLLMMAYRFSDPIVARSDALPNVPPPQDEVAAWLERHAINRG